MFEHGKLPTNTRSIQILISAPCQFKSHTSLWDLKTDFSHSGDSPGESVWGFFPQLMNYRPAWCLVLGRTQYSYPGVLLCDHNPCYTYFRRKKMVLSRDRDQFIGLCTFFSLHNWRSFFLCSLSDSIKRNLFLQSSVLTHIVNKVSSISCYAFFLLGYDTFIEILIFE